MLQMNSNGLRSVTNVKKKINNCKPALSKLTLREKLQSHRNPYQLFFSPNVDYIKTRSYSIVYGNKKQ